MHLELTGTSFGAFDAWEVRHAAEAGMSCHSFHLVDYGVLSREFACKNSAVILQGVAAETANDILNDLGIFPGLLVKLSYRCATDLV